jgi:translation initiation factor 2 alpha subunit (eIF-2alpha)
MPRAKKWPSVSRLEDILKRTLAEELEKKGIPSENAARIRKDILDNALQEYSQKIFDILKATMGALLKEREEARSSFEKRLYELWKEPLDMLEAFLHLSIEVGKAVNGELRSTATKENFFLIDAVTRLHGQACLIGGEVLTLLRGGFADGANARWRSLHEIVVIASFLRQEGNEVAKRYLEHNTVESYKALREYQKNARRLKLIPFTSDEESIVFEEHKRLIKKYGNSYGNAYGWASSGLGVEKPNIANLEKSVKLDHLRPYYRLASHHIHPNPKSVLFKLGLSHSSTRAMILAGASNAGLAEAGQGMAISLNQINNELLDMKASMIKIATQKAMLMWVEELCGKFVQVHRIVERHQAKDKS